ncbi:MAG TPA: DUF4230 domain-containing protein [Pirellulaceae bacterium]|nr:DUF4230 domain-containing protein [Pirellulaceae bacterium]
MIKLLAESLPRLVVLVAGLLILVSVVGLSAYFGSRLAAPNTVPVTYRSTGPTVQQLEGMGELATVRVNIIDVLTAEGDGYKGSWLIKGDALLACDMSAARVLNHSDELQTATIELPLPAAMSPRVDHEKTKTWSVEKTTWIPWRAGNQDAFRDGAMIHAQRLVEEAAGSEENIGLAKTHTELLMRKTFELVGWHVDVRWHNGKQESSEPSETGSR